MSPDRLSKGVRIGALVLLVSTLAACGTATVVRPGGGSAGGGVTTPKSSGVSNRASSRVSQRITMRLEPQARVVHRNPPMDRRARAWVDSGSGRP